MPPTRIAIIGTGPIGLEAALHAADAGHDVQLFERGRVADSMRCWGHVRLFSPWKLNHSQLGLGQLRAAGVEPPDDDAFLTGAEHVAAYLDPLARSVLLSGRVHERHAVRHVGRETIGKADLIGGPRDEHPFRLLVDGPSGERLVHADVVLDCSGTYGQPNWMGNGNVPALGERRLRSRIAYDLEDLASPDRYAAQRLLLVGAGHSAATALELVLELPQVHVIWVSRDGSREPLPVIENDPLPERARLSQLANRLAAGEDGRVEFRAGCSVNEIREDGDGFAVILGYRGTQEQVRVDRVLALVGYSPDNSIYRELQVHECYASLGPMKLATTLLGQGSADCLAQTSGGAEALRNPEPNFYLLGAKSYGRNSQFLIRLGLQQVREVLTLIGSRSKPVSGAA